MSRALTTDDITKISELTESIAMLKTWMFAVDDGTGLNPPWRATINTLAKLLVPFNDATNDLNLNGHDITAIRGFLDSLHLSLTPTAIPTDIGATYWDEDAETYTVILPNGVHLQLGEENYVNAKNTTGSTIVNGTPVCVIGESGQRPTIGIARSDDTNKLKVIGVTTHDIITNGRVTTFGLVRAIPLTVKPVGETWIAGNYLWVAPTGGMTNIEPVSPTPNIRLGMILNVTGSASFDMLVYIRPAMGLYDLYDVNGSAPTITGESLEWDNTLKYWKKGNKKEDSANKETTLTDGDIKFPTSGAVKAVVDELAGTGRTTETVKGNADAIALKENTANKKTTIADNDTDFPTSGAVVDYVAPVEESIATETSRSVTKDSEHDTKLAQLISKSDALGAQVNDPIKLAAFADLHTIGDAYDATTLADVDQSSVRVDGALDLTIKGQTVTNSFVNGDLTVAKNWVGGASGTVSLLNNILSHTGTGTAAICILYKAGNNTTASIGDKIFMYSRIRVTNAVCASIRGNLVINGTSHFYKVLLTPTQDVYNDISGIVTATMAGTAANIIPNFYHYYADAGTASGKVMQIDGNYGCKTINLTQMFGAGNEPTEAQCLAQFSTHFNGTKSVLPMEYIIHGKNFFDRSKAILGYKIHTDGTLIASSGDYTSDYMRVAPLAQMVGKNEEYAWYDKDKVFISYGTGTTAITAPDIAVYLRISSAYTGIATMQIEQNSVATTYEPYKDSIATSPVPLRGNATTQDTFDVKTGIHTQNVSAIDYTTLATPVITQYPPQDLTCGVHLLQKPYKSEVFITDTSGQLTTTYDIGSIRHVWAYDAEGEYELTLTTDYTVAGNVISIVGAGANVVISVDYDIAKNAPNSRVEYSTPIKNTATRLNALEVLLTVLAGGTTGQVLSKVSNDDFDFAWVTQ